MFYLLGLAIPYTSLDEADIALYNDYMDAKKNKDFERSDILRNKLIEKNIL